MDSPDLERAVLGACLSAKSAAAVALRSLTDADFTLDSSRLIWQAITRCHERDLPIDKATVYANLPKQDLVGGVELLDLESLGPIPSHIHGYVSLLKSSAAKRTLQALLKASLARCSSETSALTIAADLQSDLHAALAAPESTISSPEALRAVLGSWMRQMDAGPLPTIPTPYDRLNGMLGGGISAGELAYLGGRRGTGKTAMALQWGVTAAQAGTGVLLVSREMLKLSLARRLIAQVGNVSSMDLKRGTLLPADWAKMTAAYGELSGLPIWLTDGAESIDQIESAVTGFTQAPIGLVIVDYLQLIRAPKHVKERRLQVEEVSARLKTLAMQKSISILCLSSMRRPEKGDESIEPTLSDFRESGEIEHDGDIVMALHRPPMTHDGKLLLWKSRDGEVGAIPMQFSGATLRFREVEHG